jgi:hypothetical protein
MYREAVFVWEGRTLKACWRLNENERVNSVDEEGDFLQPPIPMGVFRKDSGA